MSKDYIIGLSNLSGNVLYADDKNVEFDDVANIDKITAHMSLEELENELKKYNDCFTRRDRKFILEKNSKGQGNLYRLFTNETTSKTEKYLYTFDEYIDERIQRVNDKNHDKTCKLELARTPDFEEYTNEMLDDVIRGLIKKQVSVYDTLSVKSLVNEDIIKHIYKVKDKYNFYSVRQKELELRHIGRSLTCYKSLRSFLMEYIRYKNNQYGGLNQTLFSAADVIKNGKYYLSDNKMDKINEDIKRKVRK